MIKLNGWHRLWIFVCIVYFSIIFTFVIFIWPSANETVPATTEIDAEALEAMAKAKNVDIQKIQFPNNQTIQLPASLNKNEAETISAKYWRSVENTANNNRKILLLDAFLWWLIPSLILYIIGYSIAWIIRGFKNQERD